MHLKLKKHPGETITEVLVSVVILVAILASSFAVLKNAIATNVDVRNRIIALNIAREGIEGVRNIRDTNWLKYSGDRRGKWLCHDTPDSLNTCADIEMDPSLALENGYYKIDFSPEYKRYFLENIVGAEEINIKNDSAEKNQFKLFKSTKEGIEGRFVHDAENGINIPFYRQIELEVENPFGGSPPGFCDSPPCAESRLRVVSRVQWREEKNLRTIRLEGYLLDFFERNDYN